MKSINLQIAEAVAAQWFSFTEINAVDLFQTMKIHKLNVHTGDISNYWLPLGLLFQFFHTMQYERSHGIMSPTSFSACDS
ncbi:hypothetical protein T07_9950 [Trichinella nelsoni]|uniref:Uncharacterized protein n=1 Tax=Trichinella nelsoni TaxID=6336 RepID=A0A0V0S0R8_9BILA|nr:hypothetical protein T07_9950 [Trichinella nelsoni]